MSTLVISDLAVSKDLDQAAVMKIRGGYTGGWQVARQLEDQPRRSSGLVPSIYNIITNNYNLYQNPTIFNVYNSVGNDNSDSGNLSFNTLSVNAASPLLLTGN
jgi:hypothetical protein